jgi:hypothetical protein
LLVLMLLPPHNSALPCCIYQQQEIMILVCHLVAYYLYNISSKSIQWFPIKYIWTDWLIDMTTPIWILFMHTVQRTCLWEGKTFLWSFVTLWRAQNPNLGCDMKVGTTVLISTMWAQQCPTDWMIIIHFLFTATLKDSQTMNVITQFILCWGCGCVELVKIHNLYSSKHHSFQTPPMHTKHCLYFYFCDTSAQISQN